MYVPWFELAVSKKYTWNEKGSGKLEQWANNDLENLFLKVKVIVNSKSNKKISYILEI